MKDLRKIFYILGVGAAFLLAACWVVAALGVAEVIGQLLWASLTGWYKFSGLRRVYLFGGAITVLILSIIYGIPAMVTPFRDIANDWFTIIVAVVALGCIPIIAIPLAAAGWPLVLWLIIADQVKKKRKSSSL